MKKYGTSKPDKKFNLEMLKQSAFIELEEISLDEFMEAVSKTGKKVTEEEAIEMLDFLHMLTRITIKQYFSPE